ncbi:MAG: hypothetical protein KTR16_02100 [Acidiferrobacterales bacterium]|nr:hypothetical protein [Acidiferrobacterales bacterium]
MTKDLIVSLSEQAKAIHSEKLKGMLCAFAGNIHTQTYEKKVKFFCFYKEYVARGLSVAAFKYHSKMLECFKQIESDEVIEDEQESIKIEDSNECEVVELDLVAAKKYIKLSERSANKGMEFNLSLSDIQKLLKRKKCQYTGAKISYMNDETHEKLTFDRLDNSIGYVNGNVFAVSDTANQVKNMLLEHPDSPLKGSKLTLKSIESSIKMLTTIKGLMAK